MAVVNDTGATLKALQVRRRKLQSALEVAGAGASQKLMPELGRIDKAIHDLTGVEAEPVVSEHALLRYIERVKGLDMQVIRDEILNGRRDAIRALGTLQFKTGNGLTIVVKDRVVVTVMD